MNLHDIRPARRHGDIPHWTVAEYEKMGELRGGWLKEVWVENRHAIGLWTRNREFLDENDNPCDDEHADMNLQYVIRVFESDYIGDRENIERDGDGDYTSHGWYISIHHTVDESRKSIL